MKEMLRELRTHGSATSRDIADALGWTVKKASTYLARAHGHGMVKAIGKHHNGFARPSIIWAPR